MTATNAGGSTAAISAQTAVVAPNPAAPHNTTLPVISGTASEGQTLSTSDGTWTNNPTGFGYQWQDCDPAGANCQNVASGATSSSYLLRGSDVGSTVRVVVTATNGSGSTPASSAATAVVQALPRLGKASVGASVHGLAGGYLEVSGAYVLGQAGSVSTLTGYLKGGSAAVAVRAVIYADSGSNRPGVFVAVSKPVSIAAGQQAGWVSFPLAGVAGLPAGKYWLGYWVASSGLVGYYDSVSGGGAYAPAGYSATGNPPASWPAGGSMDTVQYSLYATLASL